MGVFLLLYLIFPFDGPDSPAFAERIWASCTARRLRSSNIGVIALRTHIWIVGVDSGRGSRQILVLDLLLLQLLQLLLHLHIRGTLGPVWYTRDRCKLQERFFNLWRACVGQALQRTRQVQGFAHARHSCGAAWLGSVARLQLQLLQSCPELLLVHFTKSFKLKLIAHGSSR